MLTSLEIENFKGIKQGKLEGLAQVNVLVGRNNSGKSTILDALVMLRCALVRSDYTGKDGIRQILTRRVERRNLHDSELWFHLGIDEPIILSVAFVTGKGTTETWIDSQDVRVQIGLDKNLGRIESAASPDNFMKVGAWQRYGAEVGEPNARYLSLIHLLDSTSIHYPYSEILWPKLTQDRSDNKIRKMLEDIYGLDIDYITSMPFPTQQRLMAALPHAGVAVDWLGDGFRYAVNILSLGVLLRGTALLVEELETHQHPESLRQLTRVLFELAKAQELQLFLTTHSMELITYALDAAEETGLDLKLHHLSMDREGTLTSNPMSQPDSRLLLDIGHDPRLHYKYLPTE